MSFVANALATLDGMRSRMNVPASGMLPPAVFAATAEAIERGRIDLESRSGSDQVADQQTEHERARRREEEVDHRLAGDTSDGSEITDVHDASDHDDEDQRCDHHLDQADEPLADNVQHRSCGRSTHPDQDAESHTDRDLHEERAVPASGSTFRCSDVHASTPPRNCFSRITALFPAPPRHPRRKHRPPPSCGRKRLPHEARVAFENKS
ncbi:hypothetical protein QP157_21305 [Sphingomonas sp. LR61]